MVLERLTKQVGVEVNINAYMEECFVFLPV